MAKPQVKPKEVVKETAYTVLQKDSGWFITELNIENGIIVSRKKLTEPDVLAITNAKLMMIIEG